VAFDAVLNQERTYFVFKKIELPARKYFVISTRIGRATCQNDGGNPKQ